MAAGPYRTASTSAPQPARAPGSAAASPREGGAVLEGPGILRNVDGEAGAELVKAVHGDAPTVGLGCAPDLGQPQPPAPLATGLRSWQPDEGLEQHLLLLHGDVASMVVHHDEGALMGLAHGDGDG